MSIANLENVVSNAERRALVNGERFGVPRIADLAHLAPSARGKLELTMAEDEGHEDKLIGRLVAEAVKNVFAQHLDVREFRPMIDYFEAGKAVELADILDNRTMVERVEKVPGLRKRAEDIAREVPGLASESEARDAGVASAAEFILEGLHVHNKLNKNVRAGAASYKR
jgi:magnesium chelatase subunit I